MTSLDTMGSSATWTSFGSLAAAAYMTSLTWSIVTSLVLKIMVRSSSEPFGIGTLSAVPSIFPLKWGNIVGGRLGVGGSLGMMFSAAERERRKSTPALSRSG